MFTDGLTGQSENLIKLPLDFRPRYFLHFLYTTDHAEYLVWIKELHPNIRFSSFSHH
jgi:hypothetical protein